ncbi:5'-methylthioadenosine phosphorylase, partial [mine drainage metagenome]
MESRVPVADTPWGAPSGEVIVGRCGAQRVLFLARHGAQHTLAPHAVNYRANLWRLQQLGARAVLGVELGGRHPCRSAAARAGAAG